MMQDFEQLNATIAQEAQVVRRMISRDEIQWVPNSGNFQFSDGLIQVNLHRGIEKQIKQRVKTWQGFSKSMTPLDAEALCQAVASPNTVTLLQPMGEGSQKFKLYGLVNPNWFQSTDKMTARSIFHTVLGKYGVDTSQPIHGVNHYGAPVESFALPEERFTRAKISLHYGLDSGCDAYKLWLDDIRVITCGNLLMPKQKQYRWEHIKQNKENVSLEEFLDTHIPMLVKEHQAVNQKIQQARQQPNYTPIAEIVASAYEMPSYKSGGRMIDRITTAVSRQYEVEVEELGYQSRWAVSQALSYVGTHASFLQEKSTCSLKKPLQSLAHEILQD